MSWREYARSRVKSKTKNARAPDWLTTRKQAQACITLSWRFSHPRSRIMNVDLNVVATSDTLLIVSGIAMAEAGSVDAKSATRIEILHLQGPST
ncbi:MAG: hypothetical protein ABJB02_03710 [Dokdonella sp.]